MVCASVKTNVRSAWISAGGHGPEKSHQEHQRTLLLTRDKSWDSLSLPGLSSDLPFQPSYSTGPSNLFSREKSLLPPRTQAASLHIQPRRIVSLHGMFEA